MMNIRSRETVRKILVYFFLSFIAFIVVVPFVWMVLTSLKTEAEAVANPPVVFPSSPRWLNYVDALTEAPFIRYLINTVIVAIIVVLVSTAVSIFAAYAFAWMEFPLKNALFFLILASMMIPQEMLIITNFMTVANLGWINTYKAIIIPYCVDVLGIFLLRQNMMQIPKDLFTASRIDGLGHFRFLRKVVLPMVKPSLLTSMILVVIRMWNVYAWPNLVTTKDELRLVSNGLANAFTTTTGQVQYELQMAAATIVTIPLIVLFLLLRKNIFSGMKMGGIKG